MRFARPILLAFAATIVLAGAAVAQYLPTPEPDLTTDPGTGANIGCERAYGTAACGGAGPARPVAPPKPDVWGAIAVSPSLGWGTSWNFKSQKDANAKALAGCQAQSKTGCKVAVSVADVCVALAISDKEKVYAIGGPIGAVNFAEDNGALKCQRAGGHQCKIATSFCADGQKHELKGQTVFSNGNPIFVPDGQSAGFGRRR
jgi:hypothetical protein